MSKRRPVFDAVQTVRIPEVEPRLPGALAGLSERQRTVVLLIHCFQWTQSEVGDLLDLSKTTVQNHLERGMGRLRREIGGNLSKRWNVSLPTTETDNGSYTARSFPMS